MRRLTKGHMAVKAMVENRPGSHSWPWLFPTGPMMSSTLQIRDDSFPLPSLLLSKQNWIKLVWSYLNRPVGKERLEVLWVREYVSHNSAGAIKCMDADPRLPGFKSWLWYSLAVEHWADYLTSLCLDFFIYKERLIPAICGIVRIKWANLCAVSRTVPGT